MEIEKCVKLYRDMSDCCAKTGYQDNQATVYSDIADFIADCATAEDAMDKINNSDYYLASSVAKIQDKLAAYKRFAEALDIPEIAKIVDAKTIKINNDIQEIYVADWEQQILNILTKYLNSLQAFGQIFNFYVQYLCTNENDALEQIESNLQCVNYPTSSFSEASKLNIFREQISIDDIAYAKFVNSISIFVTYGKFEFSESLGSEIACDNSWDSEESWEIVKRHKNEILSYSSREDSDFAIRKKLANMKAVAPEFSVGGDFDFKDLHYQFEELYEHNSDVEIKSGVAGKFFNHFGAGR